MDVSTQLMAFNRPLEIAVLLQDDMAQSLAGNGLTVARSICCGNYCGDHNRSPGLFRRVETGPGTAATAGPGDLSCTYVRVAAVLTAATRT